MSLNYKEIDLVLSELELGGSFVQDVVQPNFDSLALYTFKPGRAKTVFVSLAALACRICETRRKITKNEKPLRFNELLKAKIKGARIISAEQIGKERIIKIVLEKAGAVFVMPKAQEKFAHKSKNRAEEDSGDEVFVMYIRLWSNAANIFLCTEDGTIIDCFFRRPAKGEVAGGTFVVPEPRGNGKEFEARDFSDTAEKLRARMEERGYSRDISYNELVDSFYSEGAAQASLASLLEQAEKWYESHRSRISSSLEMLREKRASFLDAGKFKHMGDLVLSFGHLIDGKSNFIEADDWESGEKVRIRIDPSLSAHENAQSYYEKYRKSESGIAELERDISIAEGELEKLDAQYAEMVAEKNPIKLEQVLRKTQRPKQLEKKTHPGLEFSVDGWTIIVGRDADENDELLRHNVKGQDMWLHVRDYSGGYVFIKNRPGKTVPLEILLYAGNLAVFYSKARKNGSADLYYTQVKHLRRAKDGPKGLVLPTNEKNLFIKLDEEKLRRLEDIQKGIRTE